MTNQNDKAVDELSPVTRIGRRSADEIQVIPEEVFEQMTFEQIDTFSGTNTFSKLDQKTEARRSAEISEKLSEIFDGDDIKDKQNKPDFSVTTIAVAITGAAARAASRTIARISAFTTEIKTTKAEAITEIKTTKTEAITEIKTTKTKTEARTETGIKVATTPRAPQRALSAIKMQAARVLTPERRLKISEVFFITGFAIGAAYKAVKHIVVKAASGISYISAKAASGIKYIVVNAASGVKHTMVHTGLAIRRAALTAASIIKPIALKTSSAIKPIALKTSSAIKPIAQKTAPVLRLIASGINFVAKPVSRKAMHIIRPAAHFAYKHAGSHIESYIKSAYKVCSPKVKGVIVPVLSRIKRVKRTTWIAVSGGGAGAIAVAMAFFLFVGSPTVSVAALGQSAGQAGGEDALGTLVEKVKDEISAENSGAVIIIDDQKVALAASPQADGTSETDVVMDDAQLTQLKESLLASNAVKVSAYSITVDGDTIGTFATNAEAQSVLDTIVDNYSKDDLARFEWQEDVRIVNIPADLDSLTATPAAVEFLLGSNQEVETYTVKAGDTLWDISQDVGKSLDDIADANPILDIEDIHEGDEIKLTKLVQNIHVETFEEVTKTEAVQFKTKKIDSSELYKGETKVKKAGVLGEREVTYEVKKVNGEKTSQKELSEVIIKKAKTQTIYVGTKAKPEGDTFSDGSGRTLSRPMRNMQLSSGYMAGRHHTGADFRNPSGTPIYASASGTVTYAGWDGSYGNIVRINHGGGLATWYAHCSSMLVRVGQSVSRGQQIARVGATGRATGYHLHFEVRINGSPRNPLGYL